MRVSARLALPPTVFGISALGNLYQARDHAAKRAIVAACVTTGGQPCFDGAGKYGAGLALEELGTCLRELGVATEQVLISNKLGWRRAPLTTREPTFEPGVWHDLRHDAVQDLSVDGIRACHAEGHQLLGGYRVSLVSLHDPDEYLASARDEGERERRWRDVLAAYEELLRWRARGEVLAVGVGAKDHRVIARIAAAVDLDWAMLACSLTVLHHPPEVLALVADLHRRGVAVINSAVFHGGFLTGGDHFDYRRIDPADPTDAARLAWRERFVHCCHTHGADPTAVCVQFGMRLPGVVATALNTSRAERVAANVRFTTDPVPAAVWAGLRDAGVLT